MSRLIQVAEAARRIGVSRQTIENWSRKGVLDVIIIGKAHYVKEDVATSIFGEAMDVDEAVKNIKRLKSRCIEEKRRLEATFYEYRVRNHYLQYTCKSSMLWKFFDTVLNIMSVCKIISTRDRDIMIRYINGDTMASIAKDYELTSERVRQVVSESIRAARDLTKLEKRLSEVEDIEAENKILKSKVEYLEHEVERWKIRSVLRDEEEGRIDAIRRILQERLSDQKIISIRTLNNLRRVGIYTIGDLVQHSRMDILKSRNMGMRCLDELDALLNSLGLQWGMDIDSVIND